MQKWLVTIAGLAGLGLALTTPAAAGWLDGLKIVRPPAPVVKVQATDSERFNRIEAQMRMLTGQVEELQYQVRQLVDQLQRMQADSDFRLRELEGGTAGAVNGQATASPLQDSAAVPLPAAPANAQRIGNTVTQQPPARVVGGGSQPLDLSALARSADELPQLPVGNGTDTIGQIASAGITGDPARDYQRGYDMLLTGNYPGAETTFREFLNAYPGDARAPDAQFWIGESYFARGQYREAADEFLAGFNAYPDSAKGPDNLLKLGLSLAGLGEREAACSTYATVLKRYPQATNALRQRVISEQAVASC